MSPMVKALTGLDENQVKTWLCNQKIKRNKRDVDPTLLARAKDIVKQKEHLGPRFQGVSQCLWGQGYVIGLL